MRNSDDVNRHMFYIRNVKIMKIAVTEVVNKVKTNVESMLIKSKNELFEDREGPSFRSVHNFRSFTKINHQILFMTH